MPSFCSACKYSTTSCGGTGPYSEDSSVRICSAGEEYAYEALNLANGQRTAEQIRTLLSSEYGPVPPQLVVEYLQALQKLGIVK